MRCPKCGEENPTGTHFCRRCGQEIPRSRRPLALMAALLGIGIVVALTVFLFSARVSTPAPSATATLSNAEQTPPAASPFIHVGVAYGTEKQDWLKGAVAEFGKTPQASNIVIELKPMGSLEAANAIVHGDASINVWSPASSLYKNTFIRNWNDAHGQGSPILSEAPLALTPMVFVIWQERYDPFISHYQALNFRTVGQAMYEPGGWNSIAKQPDWMFFKFSHTNPGRSNSGLMSLALMGYDYHGTHTGLTGAQITDAKFQEWVRSIEHGLSGAANGLTDSTGTLMTSMVQRGPSTYDAIFVYESVAIDRIRQARGRWGDLRVVYPRYNMWNDNPYYVLNVPGTSDAQQQAAKTFLEFLLSEPTQRQAMAHGFRPANVQVPTNAADSPFVTYKAAGFRPDVPGEFCDYPPVDVIDNLLLAWQASQVDSR